MKKLLVPFIFVPTLLFSQSRKERKALAAQQKADQQIIVNFKSHIQYLAANNANKVTSQNAVTNSTDPANYIANQFKSEGLQPKGTNGFLQPFSAPDGKRIENSTYLKVRDTMLELNKEYFPLPYSAEKKVAGMPAMALREKGVPWFTDLKDWLEEGAKTQGYKLEETIKKEVVRVAAKGATALFLYNSGSIADGIRFEKKDTSVTLPIPVIYLTNEGYKKYFSDNSQILDIELNVGFRDYNITGNNVIGYLDNRAPVTIVVGAHFNAPPALQNGKNLETAKTPEFGADENGSGIAMLIELARMLSGSRAKNNNYLFIALGGEDQGISAAGHWLTNSTLTAPINYMLNVDMVGSYSDSKSLLVQGYTSSPLWNVVFASIPDKKITVTIDSNAIAGPSAPFYEKGIPVLSFSSAAHGDYINKPDEEGKINYAGELQILKFIDRLIEATDTKGKVAFAKASDRTTAIVAPSDKVQSGLLTTLKPRFGVQKPVAAGNSVGMN